jgi:SAM-dependent methyltransferase
MFLDVHNKQYNSTGKLSAETLRFPYGTQDFDCVIITSVFTHMLPAGVHNYIHELSRVMKPGAYAFITTFLLNEESAKGIRSVLPFRYHLGECQVIDKVFPEAAISMPENQIMAWFLEARLKVISIMYGSWAGKVGCENLHDNLVVQKF